MQFELDEFATRTGRRVTFNKEARDTFLEFALSPTSAWTANFRDLNGAVTRMATLAEGGRITPTIVNEEILRLNASWSATSAEDQDFTDVRELLRNAAEEIDLFDKMQLAQVADLCSRSNSLSDAGRQLFSISRNRKSIPNDADRLRKYLHRFALTWDQVSRH